MERRHHDCRSAQRHPRGLGWLGSGWQALERARLTGNPRVARTLRTYCPGLSPEVSEFIRWAMYTGTIDTKIMKSATTLTIGRACARLS